MIAVHVFKNSPKKPSAKLSFYLQRRKRGVTWRGGGHIWVRHHGRWDHIMLGGGR